MRFGSPRNLSAAAAFVGGRSSMSRRLIVVIALAAGVLLAFAAGNLRFAVWTEPNVRAVERRGPLSDAERANIEMFERVSPSVVQVAAQSAANPLSEETEGSGAASGTGFV